MIKRFSSSPLPFRGSKRYYVRRFREVLAQTQDIDTVVDLFGGSGLLSRVAKDTLPNCRVIYNDFDHYDTRLANAANTNALLRSIAPLLVNVPDNKKVPTETKIKILELCAEEEKRHAVDYITLSGSLLFSGNWAQSYEELSKQTMYNRMVKTDYNVANYLSGLEVTHCDYRELFNAHKTNKKALFLLDPPYLQTEHSAYKADTYWQLKDYLDVLTLLDDTKYVLFTSGKSQIIELCDWINQSFGGKLLKGTQKYVQNSRINGFAAYKDIMIAKL